MIKVEKDVPMPFDQGDDKANHIKHYVHFMPEGVDQPETGGRPPKYPFFMLEVGDSVLLPIMGGKDRTRAVASSKYTASKNGWKFKYRDEDCGIRFWRVK